ncbi:MAG: hypothetical protein CMB79_18515 [Filomicrobium sp.]|nr:hypothetical protein [Filomicrobium sp.]
MFGYIANARSGILILKVLGFAECREQRFPGALHIDQSKKVNPHKSDRNVDALLGQGHDWVERSDRSQKRATCAAM